MYANVIELSIVVKKGDREFTIAWAGIGCELEDQYDVFEILDSYEKIGNFSISYESEDRDVKKALDNFLSERLSEIDFEIEHENDKIEDDDRPNY